PDGKNPVAGLVQGRDGAMYGTTHLGGASGYGTGFKQSTDMASWIVLHSFGVSDLDGKNPRGGLVQGIDGALYGTTEDGGSNGQGTVFKLNPDGTGYSVLHSFTASGDDGRSPSAGLVQGRDGALYGTAYEGGFSSNLYRFGTIFKLNADGTGYSVLHSFSGGPGDGQNPTVPLVQGSDGALYGTTTYGGSH